MIRGPVKPNQIDLQDIDLQDIDLQDDVAGIVDALSAVATEPCGNRPQIFVTADGTVARLSCYPGDLRRRALH